MKVQLQRVLVYDAYTEDGVPIGRFFAQGPWNGLVSLKSLIDPGNTLAVCEAPRSETSHAMQPVQLFQESDYFEALRKNAK